VNSGKGQYVVALKLRNGDVGVWLVDSIIDASLVLSIDSTASSVSGWGMAGSGEYTAEAVGKAKSCLP
jgi:hypothetical protein